MQDRTTMFQENLSENQIEKIQKWIEALRSGKYKQGKQKLYDKEADAYCCLGVACREFNFPEFNEKENAFLTKSYKSLGLLSIGGMICYEGFTEDSLVDMNDNGCSFQYIADLIEKHLKERIDK